MSDLVRRLRRHIPRPITGAIGDLHEAADRIEELERQLREARNAALEEAADYHDRQIKRLRLEGFHPQCGYHRLYAEAIRALKTQKGNGG